MRATASSRSGVITSGIVATSSTVLAVALCHPMGRSGGTAKLASPTKRSPRAMGSTYQSSCSRSTRSPFSRSTCTRTDCPWVTCTHNRRCSPWRPTKTGGSMRRQLLSRASSRPRSIASSPVRSTPSAASTASTVVALTPTCERA